MVHSPRRIPSSSFCSQGGFTLAEALATLFLVGTAFALVASLASELSRNTRFHRTQQALTQAALVTMDSICSEAAQSVSVRIPGSGSLLLERVDPMVKRFDEGAMGWDPRATEQLLSVRYELQQGELRRQVDGVTRVLLKDAAEFEAERTGSLLNLRLAISNNGREVWYRLGVHLPMERTL